MLRKAQPGIRFSLELLTRDALKVPCLSQQFWKTMPGLPASDLARTLRFVRKRQAKSLQQVSSRSLEEQVTLEDANVASSLQYARDSLGI